MVEKKIKTTKGGRKKKSEKKKLDDECLKLWSKCVIARDHTCRNCNSDYRLSSHHIRSVTNHSTKYNVDDNGICLCWPCHSLQKFRPEKFQDMVLEIIGQGKYDYVKRLSRVIVDFTVADLRDQKEYLQAKLKDLKSG
jgi:hypothetical protein